MANQQSYDEAEDLGFVSDDEDQMVSYYNIKSLCGSFAPYHLLQFLKEAYIAIDRLWCKLGDCRNTICKQKEKWHS